MLATTGGRRGSTDHETTHVHELRFNHTKTPTEKYKFGEDVGGPICLAFNADPSTGCLKLELQGRVLFRGQSAITRSRMVRGCCKTPQITAEMSHSLHAGVSRSAVPYRLSQ